MPKKLKILVSAYACAPNKGSEPGMGWNFVTGLANFNELHVIVEKRKWEQPILEYLKVYPELKANLRFYFIDKTRNKWLRKLWPPSYYWFYNVWQIAAYKLALELDKKENFDIIHQLNMVGYREPGYLWKINKPFVWGPIGGLENSPWILLPAIGLKGFVFYAARNLINSFQRTFNRRPRKAVNRINNRIIAATPENAKLIYEIWNKKSEVICEVGKETQVKAFVNKRSKETKLKIIWSGQHTSGKNLPLLLKILKDVNFKFELHILGTGEMTSKWKKIAIKYRIEIFCKWYGWLKRDDAINVMKSGHVFCITSIKDLTSSVLLEAISLGLPVITLDHCGFSHVVNKSCGIKIPIDSKQQIQSDFTKALQKIYQDETFRQELSNGAIKRSEYFSWDKKITQLNLIYQEVLNQ